MRSSLKKNIIQAMCLVLSLAGSAMLYAQPQLSLEMSTELQLITEANGDTQINYEPTETAQPGEILAYTISYNNSGNESAMKASMVGGIPAGATFVEVVDPQDNIEIRFSINEGLTYELAPVSVTVVNGNGESITREVGPESYTHIRFTLDFAIEPGSSGSVRYLVRIN